jgi:hypothetical protein
MKRIDVFLKVSIFMAILLCATIVLDYLPLHDIYHDYVSVPILTQFNIRLPAEFPSWTSTELEWNIVTYNYLLKIIIAISNLSLIILLKKMIQGRNASNLEQS